MPCAFIVFEKIPCPVLLFHTVRLLDTPEYGTIQPYYSRNGHIQQVMVIERAKTKGKARLKVLFPLSSSQHFMDLKVTS